MSIRIMTRVWDDAPFDGYTLMVLLALADNANDEGWCWPKVETIMRKTRCAERSVYQAIKTLCEAGWLQKTRREGSPTLFYRVTPPATGAGGAGDAPAIGAVGPAYGAEVPAIGAEPPNPHKGRTVRNRKEPSSAQSDAPRLELVASPARPSKDARFSACVDLVKRYAEGAGVAFQWGAAEGKQLKSLLDSTATLTVEMFALCLDNRARSPVAHGDPPRMWLGTLLRYQQGSLDKYGKPEVKDGTTGGNIGRPGVGGSRAEQRTASNVDAAQRAYESMFGDAVGVG